jgi:hypothetical protein
MTAFVEDRAGNKSPVLTRQVLVDYTAPTVDSASVTTSPLAGAASESFQAIVHDFLDAASAKGMLVYANVFGAGANLADSLGVVTLGTYGNDVFSKRAPASFAEPFLFAAVKNGLAGTYVLPTSLDVTPKDVAGNTGALVSFTTLFGDLSVPATDPFDSVSAITFVADSSSASFVATLTKPGEAATVPPNASVRFYTLQAGGVMRLVATATNPVITVNTGVTPHLATYTWTATPSVTLKTTVPVFAAYTTSNGVAMLLLVAPQP